jgi:hypothetical protein
MTNGMLRKRARTHVLRITVDHQPRGSPPFKVCHLTRAGLHSRLGYMQEGSSNDRLSEQVLAK